MFCKGLGVVWVKVERTLARNLMENSKVTDDGRCTECQCFGNRKAITFVKASGDEQCVSCKEFGVFSVADTIMKHNVCSF
ncbi:hypothetical protein D3C79_957740 [compost metagenome]